MFQIEMLFEKRKVENIENIFMEPLYILLADMKNIKKYKRLTYESIKLCKKFFHQQ